MPEQMNLRVTDNDLWGLVCVIEHAKKDYLQDPSNFDWAHQMETRINLLRAAGKGEVVPTRKTM